MFKDIMGYEGLYQINDEGDVKSTPSDGKPKRMLKQEIVKRKHTNYKRVSLSKNGIVTKHQVHRLVARAFISNEWDKPHVNHLDNNGENNWKNNLEWCTHSENMKHAQSQGRLFNAQSKGGKTLGKTTSSKTKWKERIGLAYNGIVIKSINTQGKHPRGDVECLLCGKDYEISLEALLMNRKTTGCKSCSSIQTHIKRKENGNT